MNYIYDEKFRARLLWSTSLKGVAIGLFIAALISLFPFNSRRLAIALTGTAVPVSVAGTLVSPKSKD